MRRRRPSTFQEVVLEWIRCTPCETVDEIYDDLRNGYPRRNTLRFDIERACRTLFHLGYITIDERGKMGVPNEST